MNATSERDAPPTPATPTKTSVATATPAAPATRPLSARAVRDVATDVRLACMRISRRVRQEGSAAIAPHLFSALCRLEQGPRTPRELADLERVSAPSMTRTVHALADSGWVTRTADPQDGRQVLVDLTSEGRAMLRSTRRSRDEWMASRLAQLTPDEVEVLARASAVLGKVAAL